MLRVIAIVVISFALSACRTDNNTTDTPPTSQQSAVSSSSQQSTSSSSSRQSTSSGSAATLPATTPTGSGENISQQSTFASGAYTAQPISPPEPAEEVLYEPVSVTLEWTIPMQRENGDLLGASDLDGYIIEYSSQSGSIEQEYVEGGQVSSHSLSLPPGAYQFRVIAVDNNGLTSNPSDWINADLA